jgi:hypothetical protein
MIYTRIDNGIEWRKGSDGNYFSTWPSRGLFLVRDHERNVWQFMAYQYTTYTQREVFADHDVWKAMAAAEIFIARN